MQRSALRWALPVALLCTLVLGLLRGPGAAGSSALGAAIALAAFLSGSWAIGLLLDHLPGAAVVGALTVYLIQLLLLVSAVLVVRELPWVDPLAAAVGLLATALAHQVGQVTGFLRARTLFVDPPLP
jgi:ATP synthase protein I